VVGEQPQADLVQIVLASAAARCFPRRLDGWQQERKQEADDGQNDQQFDQRESQAQSQTVSAHAARRYYK
jgi:hypothetical protein